VKGSSGEEEGGDREYWRVGMGRDHEGLGVGSISLGEIGE
jgi:hypothetical protein